MSRKFIAAVLAVSTTLAAFSAAPARAASDEDVARFLGSAAALFIIGKAIESARDDDKKKSSVVHYDRNRNTYYSAPKRQFHEPYRKPVIRHQKQTPKVVPRTGRKHPNRLIALPQHCVRRIDGGNVRRVVMGRCLKRSSNKSYDLPRSCRMKVNTRRGERRAYSLPCLRNRGYTIARN